MTKDRSDGQKLVAVALDEQLLAEIDARRGPKSRSFFLRETLVKHYNLPGHLAEAPDRAGKGGRPRIVRMPEPVPSAKVAEAEPAEARPLTKVRYPKGKK